MSVYLLQLGAWARALISSIHRCFSRHRTPSQTISPLDLGLPHAQQFGRIHRIHQSIIFLHISKMVTLYVEW